MACVGACPASALVDEAAISLCSNSSSATACNAACASTPARRRLSRFAPRLLLGPQAKAERVLHEAVPFNCVSCGKPFGNKQMVENMLGKLGTHPMFSGDGLSGCRLCAIAASST